MESKDLASTKTRKTDIFESVWLRGVHTTAELSSAVCITLRSQALRCASYRRVKSTNFLKKLCGVHHTAESISAVCIITRSQIPRCASHRGVKLHGVHHTAKSNCTPQSQNWNLWKSLVAFSIFAIFELSNRIFSRKQKSSQNRFVCSYRAQVESVKPKIGRTSRDTVTLTRLDSSSHTIHILVLQ